MSLFRLPNFLSFARHDKLSPEAEEILRQSVSTLQKRDEGSARLLMQQQPWMFEELGHSKLTLPCNDDYPIESLTDEDRACPLSFI